MRLLVILPRVPYSLEKGDKLRAFNQVKELSGHHEIILFALSDGEIDPAARAKLERYCTEVVLFRLSRWTVARNLARSALDGRPFQVGYFLSEEAQQKVNELVARHRPDHIYCQLIRTAEYAKAHPRIAKTLDYMDVFSKGMDRRASTDPLYMRPIIKMEYRRLLRYERDVFQYFNNKTIISEQDRDLIPHPDRGEIQVIPNGVDTDFFQPMQRPKTFELLFNGNMSYPPNIESVEYLVGKVMPLVWRELPEARLLISGANPSNAVRRLASKRVVVSGWVDDVRENYAKSKLLVAPMQISIGLQNKLLEAMAMRLPCITSSLANNALGARPGEQILVADSEAQYAAHIVDLLRNEARSEAIGKSGYDHVLRTFSWQGTTALLNDLISRDPTRDPTT
jgi:sugar transferase (PEP-CTERM/EpsH1 system associated)